MRIGLFTLSIFISNTLLADTAVLDTWLKRQATLTSLDAAFIQERKLPALKEPIRTPGHMSFQKPDRIRWQLGNPMETLAVSDGKTLTLIEAASKTARQTGIDSPHAARFSLLSGKAFQSPELFHQSFEVIEFRASDDIHQYTLKAKDRKIRSQIPWIFLSIDSNKNELRALEMELQDKSRVRTVFEKPRFNIKLDGAIFSPDLSPYIVK